MTRIALHDPRFYLNRHLQWMAFNQRVLEEARDRRNPLLERVKFLAITANNLDEFVEIRVSGFLQKIEHGSQNISPDGLTPAEELRSSFGGDAQSSCGRNTNAGTTNCCHLWRRHRDSRASGGPAGGRKPRQTARRLFTNASVYPMLTPVTVDPSHPFPHVLNKALCIAFLLRRRRQAGREAVFRSRHCAARFAARSARARPATAAFTTCFLQDIISAYAEKLYRGYEILASAPFRITRNSNLYLEEEEARTPARSSGLASGAAAQGSTRCVWKSRPARTRTSCRTWSPPSNWMNRWSSGRPGPVNLQRLFQLYEETPRPDLKFAKFVPRQVHIGHDADSHVRDAAPSGRSAAPSVRLLRFRGEFPANGGA